jgi:putative copper export protein
VSRSLEILTTFQQWTLFCGVVVVVGCVTWVAAVAPRIRDQDEGEGLRHVERRVASSGGFAVLALVAAWMLRMVVQVMGFRDPFVPLWEDVSFLLFETFWGTVWMAQGVVLPLLGVAFWMARGPAAKSGGGEAGAVALRRPWAWWVCGGLALALVATLSLSSHAMGVDSGRSLIVVADAVHTISAGSWIGSLWVILTAGRKVERGSGLFAAQICGFSPVALVSVAALTGMGVVLAWTHLQSVSDLWTIGYGRVLLAKVALVGLVLAVGLWNWKRGLPRLDTSDGQAEVQRRAAWEVSLAAGVLVLTAILVHSAKP